jgi:hypothetical protein
MARLSIAQFSSQFSLQLQARQAVSRSACKARVSLPRGRRRLVKAYRVLPVANVAAIPDLGQGTRGTFVRSSELQDLPRRRAPRGMSGNGLFCGRRAERRHKVPLSRDSRRPGR